MEKTISSQVMIRLEEIENFMKPQFVWDRSGRKRLQVNEEVEGNLELARTIFVGIADMYGFSQGDVMDHLDCGYDSYRNKLMQFRSVWIEGRKRQHDNVLYDFSDSVSRMYIKTCLCLNAIKYAYKRDPYLKMEEYISV